MPNIEELLKQAMQAGKFDDLPGKGKPLKLDDTSPHTDPEWELAYHLLREAGYSLPWIEQFREIDADLNNARAELSQVFDWRQTVAPGALPASQVDAEWQRALAAFKSKITTLNKRIRDTNLQVPNPRFQRPIMTYEQELQQVITSH